MMNDLTRLEDALQVVLDAVPVLGVEKINLLDALGRVLAEDIIAERDNPPWDNSAMDGFAVRYDDIKQIHAITTPTVLKVIEDVAAGTFPTKTVGKGEAIRIMTGAPLPQGADTVLKVEDTEHKPDSVKVFKEEQKGANIRPQGEDVRKGDCIIPQGKAIRPAEAGMLAILAKPFVFVYQRPRVAILSTGDELVDLDERLTDEKIVNSNSYGIAAAVQEAGGLPILLGIAKDNPEALKAKIRQGLNADILVLSGGVSMGQQVRSLLNAVYERYGLDFRNYADASITRRIEKAMHSENLASIPQLERRLLADHALVAAEACLEVDGMKIRCDLVLAELLPLALEVR